MHPMNPPLMRADDGEQGLDADWTGVSLAMPCPICGGSRECRTHAEEAFACCLREPSEWRLANGGWLHRIARPIAARLVSAAAEARPRGASSGIVA
jgi:hypothetical protein